MKHVTSHIVALFMFVVALCSAQAQTSSAAGTPSAEGATAVTLHVNGGVVMISDGGDAFASAAPDQQILSGERVMVSNDSSVTVQYSDGCTQTYSKPGVYVIEPDCKRAAADVASGNGVKTAAEIVGIIGIAAAITAAADHDHHKPISR